MIPVNPLLSSAHRSARIAKILILRLEGTIKNSYERRDYESVDEKSLSKAMSRKTTKQTEFRQRRVKCRESSYNILIWISLVDNFCYLCVQDLCHTTGITES